MNLHRREVADAPEPILTAAFSCIDCPLPRSRLMLCISREMRLRICAPLQALAVRCLPARCTRSTTSSPLRLCPRTQRRRRQKAPHRRTTPATFSRAARLCHRKGLARCGTAMLPAADGNVHLTASTGDAEDLDFFASASASDDDEAPVGTKLVPYPVHFRLGEESIKAVEVMILSGAPPACRTKRPSPSHSFT